MSTKYSLVSQIEESRELRARLIILEAVDAAHRSRQISSSARYEILQSLFPAFEAGHSGVNDFRVCRTASSSESIAIQCAVQRNTGIREAPNGSDETAGTHASTGDDAAELTPSTGRSQHVLV